MPTLTVTVKEARMAPGKGYEVVSSHSREHLTLTSALSAYEQHVAFWKAGSEVVEQDGTTVEIQVGAWRRVMVELS